MKKKSKMKEREKRTNKIKLNSNEWFIFFFNIIQRKKYKSIEILFKPFRRPNNAWYSVNRMRENALKFYPIRI